MNGKFITYSKCSTCRKALEWLKKNKIEFEIRSIVDEVPSVSELIKWIKLSNLDIKKFFNTSGFKYKELNLKDKLPNMSDEEKINLLATDGMLIKRPLFIKNNIILVGFKENEWNEKLK